MSSTENPETTFRKYAWDYFAIHAAQRLACFQFFITLATAMVGGFLLLIRNNGNQRWMSVFGILLVFLAFVFSRLDHRTRQLVKNGEDALKYLDGLHQLPEVYGRRNPLNLFLRDDDASQENSVKWPFIGHFSYTRCFNYVFIAFGFLGMLGATFSWLGSSLEGASAAPLSVNKSIYIAPTHTSDSMQSAAPTQDVRIIIGQAER